MTRTEVEQHIKDADHWYLRYDQIISGVLSFADTRARRLALIEAARRWEAEETWLYMAGVSNLLLYDTTTHTHHLPDGWTPDKDDTHGPDA